MRPSARLVVLLCAGHVLLLAGCGEPPELSGPPGQTGPGPGSPGSTAPAFPTLPPGLPGTPSAGSGEGIAISCAGQPGEDELLDLLRDDGVLGADTDAEVVNGPLCAGGWQYTVVSVPNLDPLQVVTRGDAAELELVTAGTDVCTVEVRIQAPPGIRDIAACVS